MPPAGTKQKSATGLTAIQSVGHRLDHLESDFVGMREDMVKITAGLDQLARDMTRLTDIFENDRRNRRVPWIPLGGLAATALAIMITIGGLVVGSITTLLNNEIKSQARLDQVQFTSVSERLTNIETLLTGHTEDIGRLQEQANNIQGTLNERTKIQVGLQKSLSAILSTRHTPTNDAMAREEDRRWVKALLESYLRKDAQ